MITTSFLTKLRGLLHFTLNQMIQLMPNLWETDQANYTGSTAEPSQIRQIQEEVDALLPIAKRLVQQLERSQAIITGIS